MTESVDLGNPPTQTAHRAATRVPAVRSPGAAVDGPAAPRQPDYRKHLTPPAGLVVFLENIGHISGINLPTWATIIIDFVAEEYAKLAMRWQGVYRRYDRVWILEDERATGPDLTAALIAASRTHRVDVLVLSHGQPDTILGYKGLQIGAETFVPLIEAYRADTSLLNLRAVWQMNCYGMSMARTWQALGADSVNGSIGVNWLPEPALSFFLHDWLHGYSYSHAVERSSLRAQRWWSNLYRPGPDRTLHPRLRSSKQVVIGARDSDIHS